MRGKIATLLVIVGIAFSLASFVPREGGYLVSGIILIISGFMVYFGRGVFALLGIALVIVSIYFLMAPFFPIL